MALEIEGKIKQKLEVQSGQSERGGWSRQAFILEYQDGKYPADICFTAFGDDKIEDLKRYQEGDEIKVSFNLKAREYNGRWYNDVRVWKIEPVGQTAQSGPAPLAPPPAANDIPPEDSKEDLPF